MTRIQDIVSMRKLICIQNQIISGNQAIPNLKLCKKNYGDWEITKKISKSYKVIHGT